MALIYYFSGTGNSKYVAGCLAELLQSEVTDIASLKSSSDVKLKDELIGIVCPMYNHGLPNIVRTFIGRMALNESHYIFGVVTFGNDMGISLEHMEKAVKNAGGRLSLGYGIQMPYNYIEPIGFRVKGLWDSFRLRAHVQEEVMALTAGADDKCKVIAEQVAKKAYGTIEATSVRIERFVDRMGLRDNLQKNAWAKVAGISSRDFLTFDEMLKSMDRGFWYSDLCTGCGTCQHVCPVDNIIMNSNRPEWQHRCEQCFACVHRCPTAALEFRQATVGVERYLHPSL